MQTLTSFMVKFLSSRTLIYLLPTDRWRALETGNTELRRDNEALKTELYVYKGATKTQHLEALHNAEGKGGRKIRDVAGSELQISLSGTGPARKRSRFE
mgnify:CR=1 FL=1